MNTAMLTKNEIDKMQDLCLQLDCTSLKELHIEENANYNNKLGLWHSPPPPLPPRPSFLFCRKHSA